MKMLREVTQEEGLAIKNVHDHYVQFNCNGPFLQINDVSGGFAEVLYIEGSPRTYEFALGFVAVIVYGSK